MMKSLGRKIACESPNLQEGSIELRNARTNLMNIALVLCLAHVTNTMGQAGDDFEKGDADGTRDALAVLAHQRIPGGFLGRRRIFSILPVDRHPK
jgi:hypothetical protein